MKKKTLLTTAIISSFCGMVTTDAATVIALNGFETNLNGWTASGASSGRYVHQTLLQPADDTTTNFASTDNGAASIGKAGGRLTSTVVDLSGGGSSETITINLNFMWHNGTSTRRAFVDYSNDGGTSWFSLAMMQIGSAGAAANKTSYTGSVTITEGSSSVTRTGNLAASNLASNAGTTAYNGAAFTNNSVFRVINNGSAGADVRLFVDDLEVTTSIVIPEPSTVLLGGIGALLLFRRRR